MALVNEITLFIDVIFASVNQIMLFIDDKPSCAFLNAWYTHSEFSSIADWQSICELSGMSAIHCNVPAYPTADSISNIHLETNSWTTGQHAAALQCFYYQISMSELGVQWENCEGSRLWRRNFWNSSRHLNKCLSSDNFLAVLTSLPRPPTFTSMVNFNYCFKYDLPSLLR